MTGPKENINRQTLSQMNQREEKTQINKIRDEKGAITTNIGEILKIIRANLENMHSTKLGKSKRN